MAKGSNFEREICKELSLWWSKGKTDAIFWRSSNSGGRATIRRRSGKATSGHAGDIAATDPSGHALIQVCALELKRGYSATSIAEVVDRNASKPKQKPFEGFIQQAETAAETEGSFSWLLIHRRDSKCAMVYFPKKFWDRFKGMVTRPKMWISLSFLFRYENKKKIRKTIYGTTLRSFLKYFKRKHFEKVSATLSRSNR